MSERDLENLFDFKINQIKAGGSEAVKADQDCKDILSKMYSNPTYHFGEVQPILNEKINSYCKASGKSYEMVAMEMNMPKLNRTLP